YYCIVRVLSYGSSYCSLAHRDFPSFPTRRSSDLGVLVLVGYYFWVPADRFEQPTTLVLLGVSAISFHLLAAVVPFWKPADSEGFWDYNKNVFINAVQSVIFTLAMWGGLALAVAAIEHLFNLTIPSDFWGYLATTV